MAKEWDAIVVGGGHNGLTCAAYLAQGRSEGRGAGTAARWSAEPPITEEIYPGLQVLGLLVRRQPSPAVDYPRPRSARGTATRSCRSRLDLHSVPRRQVSAARRRRREAPADGDRRVFTGGMPRPTRSSVASMSELGSAGKADHRFSTAPDPASIEAARIAGTCCSAWARALRATSGFDWLPSPSNLKMLTMSRGRSSWLRVVRVAKQLIAPMSVSAASSVRSSASALQAPPTCCSTTTWARSTARSAPGACPRGDRRHLRMPRSRLRPRALRARRSAPKPPSTSVLLMRADCPVGVVLDGGEEIKCQDA